MVSYGWTIDYISENVTLPQIRYLIDEINNNPPTSILGFAFSEKRGEDQLLRQLSRLGDKVKHQKLFNKKSIKSIIRLKDKVRIK